MYESFLKSLPKYREELVNELYLPENITLEPYIWTEPYDSIIDSLPSGSFDDLDLVSADNTTDSSLALSRAMTDSEIDYSWYRKVSILIAVHLTKKFFYPFR